MSAVEETRKAYHRYGDSHPVPERARLANSVSVVACRCGKVCIRFHHPATTTHPGRVFAAAFLDRKDCAEVGEAVLQAIDICRHVMPCDGNH
jgi:hypothetical protein